MVPAAFVALFLSTLPAAATAGELRMEFRDGYVSISAADVPLRQVLTEWARLGRTRVVNGEKLGGELLTLELTNVPEKQALDIILRTVPGYLAAQRTTAVPGGSQFDRIVVMPGTVAPPTHNAASAPPPPPPMQVPVPAMVEDQDQPVQESPERAEQAEQPEQAEPTEQDQQPQPQPTGQTLPQPGFQPMPQNPPGPNNPGTVQQPAGPVPTPGHGAIVSPTPGQLPAPPPPPKPQDQQDQQQQDQQQQDRQDL
jgi:hypothetical protein